MSKATQESESKKNLDGTVVVVGGNGGMSSLYRSVAEKQGMELKHYEKRMPAAVKKAGSKIALVVVMVGMVSHALLQQAQTLSDEAPVVYLRSASVSALKAAIEQKLT
jgi:hypothetical protein